MSAEVLREAAALMRERAEAATRGPWLADPDAAYSVVMRPDRPGFNWDGYNVCVVLEPEEGTFRDNSEHIASWHPAVALAVADWLDDEADEMGAVCGCTTARALAVARAYLGSDS